MQYRDQSLHYISFTNDAFQCRIVQIRIDPNFLG